MSSIRITHPSVAHQGTHPLLNQVLAVCALLFRKQSTVLLSEENLRTKPMHVCLKIACGAARAHNVAVVAVPQVPRSPPPELRATPPAAPAGTQDKVKLTQTAIYSIYSCRLV